MRIFIVLLLMHLICIPQPIIIFTAALIDLKKEERQQEYIKALGTLALYGYPAPYIVEAIMPEPPTFLDTYSPHMLYSNVNNSSLRNKGVNEARSLLEAIKKWTFDDEQMVIKITGRYFFKNDLFLRLVEQSANDAIIKADPYGQIFIGCIALRYKYLKEFLQGLDLFSMEKNMINIEQEMANYIKKIESQGASILQVQNLDLVVNSFGDGNTTLLYY